MTRPAIPAPPCAVFFAKNGLPPGFWRSHARARPIPRAHTRDPPIINVFCALGGGAPLDDERFTFLIFEKVRVDANLSQS